MYTFVCPGRVAGALDIGEPSLNTTFLGIMLYGCDARFLKTISIVSPTLPRIIGPSIPRCSSSDVRCFNVLKVLSVNSL